MLERRSPVVKGIAALNLFLATESKPSYEDMQTDDDMPTFITEQGYFRPSR